MARTPFGGYFGYIVDGTPLNYLFKMRSALRLSTVQMVVGCDPSVVGIMGVGRDSYGEELVTPPLHCLLQNESIGEMGEILRYILQLMKEQGIEVNGDRIGESPLHQICINPKATSNAVKIILEEIPDFPILFGDGVEHPVHCLCRDWRDNDKIVDYDKIVDSESIGILDLLVEFDRDCLQIASNALDRELPLHLAIGHRGIDFVKHLVDLYPEAVQKEDGQGMVPFHHACFEGGIDVCKFLLELWPESLTKVDNYGRAPIHFAAAGSAAGVIRFLLERDSTLASIATSQHELPLHLCCNPVVCREDHKEVLQVLFDAHPKAICMKTGTDAELGANKLPIELMNYELVANHNPKKRLYMEQQMQYYRLSQDIQALTTPDQLGELALHREIRNGATLGATKLLVWGYPDAVQEVNANGDYPLHIACARMDGFEAVTYLMELHPPALSSRNGEGLLPLDILSATQSQEGDTIQYIDCLFKMLRACPALELLLGH